MNREQLTLLLEKKVSASRVHRNLVADTVLNNIEALPILIEITFEPENPLAFHAAWVLEYVLDKDLIQLLPHLDFFTINLKQVKHESAIRPVAKICEFLAKAYTGRKDSLVKEVLTEQHKEQIIETGFDWMIGQHKVAIKAYTMNSLFLFGKSTDWVHDELVQILSSEIAYGSPAYQARGKQILAKIHKMKR